MAALLDYQLFYSDAVARVASAHAHEADLQDEMASYRKRQGEFRGLRAELDRLQAEQRELLRALPKRAEIPSFLASVQEQGELVGLEVLSVEIGQETPQDLYLRIPVKMEVRGTYHQIARFFRNVSELQRIVNVENLTLAPEKDKMVGIDLQGATPPKLRARFVAATFRFNDKPPAAGGKP
jgi:type IV pilus assembly protein PilO